jgi:proteic killer suppression protein
MIKSWQHKGLKLFFETGKKSGIMPEHAKRLQVLLQLLDAANNPTRMNLPGLDFHQLKGNLEGFYSIAVRANWKIIFKFDDEDAILVDYLDYH